MMYRRLFLFLFLIPGTFVKAQVVHEYNDSLVVTNDLLTVVVHPATGKVDYRMMGGIRLENTVAYVDDLHYGHLSTGDFSQHPYSTEPMNDTIGSGICIHIKHMDSQQPLYLLQNIIVYQKLAFITAELTVGLSTGKGVLPETRRISPLAVLPSQQGCLYMPGAEPRILDVPFDNDDWVGVVERNWGAPASAAGTTPAMAGKPGFDASGNATGISYELCSVYDNAGLSGLVTGSLEHDFWKTGIGYHTAPVAGVVDSFDVFGGAATPDVAKLPHAYGGQDGTHDHMEHGTQKGAIVSSPRIFLCGGPDVRFAFTAYGKANARLNGSLSWKGDAPVYWNSFGVEGVLGYEKVMMPPGVGKISDFIASLPNFNKYAPPVLSVDSYDQSIYTTELLASLGRYGKKHRQQMGFYFIPFSLWTWKSSINQAKVSDDYTLDDVVLKDGEGRPIAYKDGDWGAYALDPTHPATRQRIIRELQKAKAIDAKFIKIDFLTGGALESSRRWNPAIRSGMQAYDYGMKMLKHLIDSIMGPDIFITEAISPMFPSQYAHTRFNSTDVYSHLRDDEPGQPNWGSTESSLATGSHMWWVQGTLWPYTNLDVTIMKAFQKNHDLSEQEIKVRIYALMVMGSILGDGSDFRQPLAAERAKKYLDNKNVCAYFSHPQAFTPKRFADGDSYDQQLSFFLPESKAGSPAFAAVFNFGGQSEFKETFRLEDLGLTPGNYTILDFLTDEKIGTITPGEINFSLIAPAKDARLIKIVSY